MASPARRIQFRAPDRSIVNGSVADIIRTSRLGLGITQRELGERAGVSASTISNFERGVNSRSGGWLTTVTKVLRALDLELSIR